MWIRARYLFGKPLPDEYETYLDILTNLAEARRLYLGEEDD